MKKKKYPSENATSWMILGLALLALLLFPIYMLAAMIRRLFGKGSKW